MIYFPGKNHLMSSPFCVRFCFSFELTLAPQILIHTKGRRFKETTAQWGLLLRAKMATGFCLKKPSRPLLMIKLIQIPGVKHGPGAMSPEFELVHSDIFTGVP